MLYAIVPGCALSLDCANVKRRPQTQPPSYRVGGLKASRGLFEQYDKVNIIYNVEMPEVCDEALRVATYNIHSHKNLYSDAINTNSVEEDLKRINAGVVVFQEVVNEGSERHGFEKMLDKLGYVHRIEGMSTGAFLGNMIASKYPLVKLGHININWKRNVVAAAINFGEWKMAILGTHLEVKSAEVRQKQTREILEFIEKSIGPTFDLYLLAGDMNAEWNTSEVQHLATNGKLHEVFEAIDAPYPKYTCWAGTSIDFIFASTQIANKVAGAYNYHTTSSDHLPLMVDIVMPVKKSDV